MNIVGFAHDFGMSVLFEMLILSDGSVTEIAPIDQRLPPMCTAHSLDLSRAADFNTVFNAVFTSPDLFMALEELIGAITLPHVAPVNCARAMDSLKHSIAKPDSSDKDAWKRMHDAFKSMNNIFVSLLTFPKIRDMAGRATPSERSQPKRRFDHGQ